MIILDTNILSETLRREMNAGVVAWFEAQSSASLYTTSITQAELLVGVRALPAGKRRAALELAVTGIFDDMANRILPFDESAADLYATLLVERRRAGRPISQSDCQIAAIARSRDARLASRNVSDFDGCGIKVIDPFT